jgi:hypothetical protein
LLPLLPLLLLLLLLLQPICKHREAKTLTS